MQLSDLSGGVVFTSSALVEADGNVLRYVRLPVYTTSNPDSTAFRLLPAGQYRLIGRVLDSGQELAAASLSLRVR